MSITKNYSDMSPKEREAWDKDEPPTPAMLDEWEKQLYGNGWMSHDPHAICKRDGLYMIKAARTLRALAAEMAEILELVQDVVEDHYRPYPRIAEVLSKWEEMK